MSQSQLFRAILGVVIVCTAVGLFFAWSPSSGPGDGGGPDALRARTPTPSDPADRLPAGLIAGKADRGGKRVSPGAERPAPLEPTAADRPTDHATRSAADRAAVPRRAAKRPRRPLQPGLEVDRDLLAERGYQPVLIDELADRWDDALRARADQGPAQWADEVADLREEFGDRTFDDVLQATGSPNRIEIKGVHPGSLAESIGLQIGDRLVRYDGATILDHDDYRNAQLDWDRVGEPIVIEIERNGQPLSVQSRYDLLGAAVGPTFSDVPLPPSAGQ